MTATEVDEYAWSALGKWLKVFQALVAEPDMEWMFIDGSYAKAHPHSAGAASGKVEAIGKSQAGNTRKTGTAPNSAHYASHGACALPFPASRP